MNVLELVEKELKLFLSDSGYGDFDIDSDTNLLETVDSVLLVGLVVKTEDIVEQSLGRYIPLADENTFDVNKTPFVSAKAWLDYVSNSIL